jgi:thymidylate kinase
VAYGEAQGLDPAWLLEVQRYLPQPALTIVLDIPPEVSLQRKHAARDKFERDLPLLSRVRASYQRQATAPGWVLIDGQQDKDAVFASVMTAARSRLARP